MTSGFNVIDFMELPAVQRCIVKLVLRESSMTYPQLSEAITTLPPDQVLNQGELDEALGHLMEERWLIRDGQACYHVNTISRSKRFDEPQAEPADDLQGLARGGKRKVPSHVWECLTDDPADPPKRRFERARPAQ